MKRYAHIPNFILISLITVLLVFQVGQAQTGGGIDLSWNTLFPGGATSGGAYTMDSVIGQPFTGIVAGTGGPGGYTLCAGYLCGVQSASRVYLPLVRK